MKKQNQLKSLAATVMGVLVFSLVPSIYAPPAGNETYWPPFTSPKHPFGTIQHQLSGGAAPENVRCDPGLTFIIKHNGNPTCVKPTSVNLLWFSGWAKRSTDVYTKSASKGLLETFQSRIISKETAIQIAQNYVKQKNLTLNVNMSKPEFQITTELVYSILSQGYAGVLDVDPRTGLPTDVMPPWREQYYRNPQWWTELQKDYLGLQSNRIENGEFVWRVAWRDCPNCIAPYPEFFIDAITGKVIKAPSDWR